MRGADHLVGALADAGVQPLGPTIIAEQVEDTTVWDRPLAACVGTHTVSDFDAWKAAFDAGAGARAAAGIVGHCINRSVDNPNEVSVFAQAESVEQLRALMESPQMAEGMKRAGVTSAPQMVYLTTVESRQYA